MAQEDYDKGYEDGQESRNAEIESLKLALKWARDDLAAARESCAHYRAIVLTPRPTAPDYEVPF